MIYFELFLGFLKVGCFSFGGAYSAIPLIRDVAFSYGWMNESQLANMIAISESTPGPIMVNMATYVGASQAGFWGALLATTTVVLPAFILIILLMAILKNAIKNRYVQAIMDGLTPAIIGIILATGVYMLIHNVVQFKNTIVWNAPSGVLTVFLCLILYGSKKIFHKSMSPFTMILLAAVCGVFFF